MNSTLADADFFRLSPFLEDLRKELSMLPTEHKVAFALYCAERLFPLYVALSKSIGSSDESTFRVLLDELWIRIHANNMPQQRIVQFSDQLQEIDLGEEGCCDEWDGAVDAVGAVALTLETWRNGSSASAAKAAGNLLNRVYQRLLDEAVGTTYLLSASEDLDLTRRIENHAAMQGVREQLLEIVRVLKKQGSLAEADTHRLRSLAQAVAGA